MEGKGFIIGTPGKTIQLAAIPSARVAGRVASSVPGVKVSGLTASYQASSQRGVYSPTRNFGSTVPVSPEGRFVLNGLEPGTINVFVHGEGENDAWTYRAAKDVELVAGKTAEIVIEIVRGVEVEGTVVAQKSGAPVEKTMIGVYGPFRPRTGAATTSATPSSTTSRTIRPPAASIPA